MPETPSSSAASQDQEPVVACRECRLPEGRPVDPEFVCRRCRRGEEHEPAIARRVERATVPDRCTTEAEWAFADALLALQELNHADTATMLAQRWPGHEDILAKAGITANPPPTAPQTRLTPQKGGR